MSTENQLGTARIDVVLDTSNFDVVIQRSKNLAASFGSDAEAAFGKASGEVKKASTNLMRYVETLGLAPENVKLLRAAWQGVDISILEAANQRIQEHKAQVAAAAEQVRMLAAAEELAGIKAQHAADGAAFAKMADDAERLRRGAQAVEVFTQHLDMLELKAKHAADGEEFARMAADAERLRRGADAVAVFTEHLDLMDIKAQHAADGAEFDVMAEKAERLRRGAQAVAVFTEQLDRLEAEEAALAQRTTFLQQLENQANSIGKTRSELMALKAAELGVADAAAPFIAKLREQEGALLGATNKFNAYGLSAKQVQLALRGVPAQITDIFVSLQGGQNPLTVLLQQGGQLRDMFGGITPAAQALGRAVMGLINPWTLLAGAALTVTAAWFKGEQETNALAKALALTGHQADATTSNLQQMAVQGSQMVGTQHQWAAALAEVANQGVFVGDQFSAVARAAVEMEHATGTAIDKTVEKFTALARDPATAIAQLNEKEHFLTAAIYEQIRALQDQGQQQDAATLAINTYADAVSERTAEVEKHLGTLQTAWREIIGVAKAAWDAMLDIGREDTLSDKIQRVSGDIVALKEDNLAFLQYGAIGSAARKAEITRRQTELRALLRQERDENRKAHIESGEQQANDYDVALKEMIRRHGDADQRRADEIKRSGERARVEIEKAERAGNKALADSLRADQAEYEKRLRAEGPKRTGAGAARSIANAEARAALEEFKAQLQEEEAAISNSRKILDAQLAAKLVLARDYYEKQREFTKADTEAQERALLGQIGVLQSRNVTGKDAADVQRQLVQLESQLAKVRADGATALIILDIQEKANLAQRQKAIEAYKHGLDVSTRAMELQWSATVDQISMGRLEFQQRQDLARVYEEQAEELYKLNQQLADGLDPADYQRDITNLQVATDAKVKIIEDGYDAMLRAQDDWLAGVQAGVQDWMDEASNVAAQTRSIAERNMDTLVDGLAASAEQGKFLWRDMLIDMLREWEKFLIKKALLELAYSFMSSFGGTANYNYSGDADWVAAMAGAGGGGGGGAVGTGGAEKVVFAPSVGTGGAQVAIAPEGAPTAARMMGGAGGGGVVNLTVQTIVNNDGSSETNVQGDAQQKDAAAREFTERMRVVAREEVNKAMRPGGSLWRAGVTTQ